MSKLTSIHSWNEHRLRTAYLEPLREGRSAYTPDDRPLDCPYDEDNEDGAERIKAIVWLAGYIEEHFLRQERKTTHLTLV